MNGVLVVDKPSGPTSHDVVDRVRRVLAVRRAGHTGTLDPFATGVLPVCVGKATRLTRFLAESQKTYRATVRLGFATTTDDLHGAPLPPALPVEIEPAAVLSACQAMVGPLLQVPPAYSAKRVQGRRAYDLARRGIDVSPVAVAVRVFSLKVVRFELDQVEIEVGCSAGTYIRALARDLGRALGTGGHLTALRRLKAGGFGLECAVAWDEVAEQAKRRLLPLSDLLTDLPSVTVSREGMEALRHGRDLDQRLVREGLDETLPPRVRLLDEAGRLLALAVPRGVGPRVTGLPVEPALHPDVVLME